MTNAIISFADLRSDIQDVIDTAEGAMQELDNAEWTYSTVDLDNTNPDDKDTLIAELEDVASELECIELYGPPSLDEITSNAQELADSIREQIPADEKEDS